MFCSGCSVGSPSFCLVRSVVFCSSAWLWSVVFCSVLSCSVCSCCSVLFSVLGCVRAVASGSVCPVRAVGSYFVRDVFSERICFEDVDS